MSGAQQHALRLLCAAAAAPPPLTSLGRSDGATAASHPQEAHTGFGPVRSVRLSLSVRDCLHPAHYEAHESFVGADATPTAAPLKALGCAESACSGGLWRRHRQHGWNACQVAPACRLTNERPTQLSTERHAPRCF